MVKHSRHSRHSRHSKKHTRKQKGGMNSPSAWSYVYDTVGNGWTQFQNALTLQPGENLGSINSNAIEPVNNINAQDQQGVPSLQNLSLIQSAGKRHRKHGKKHSRKMSKKGGSWAAVANQAIVPLTLFGLQNRFKKRTLRKSRKSRKM